MMFNELYMVASGEDDKLQGGYRLKMISMIELYHLTGEVKTRLSWGREKLMYLIDLPIPNDTSGLLSHLQL